MCAPRCRACAKRSSPALCGRLVVLEHRFDAELEAACDLRAPAPFGRRARAGFVIPATPPTPHTTFFLSPKCAPQPIMTHLGAPTSSACMAFLEPRWPRGGWRRRRRSGPSVRSAARRGRGRAWQSFCPCAGEELLTRAVGRRGGLRAPAGQQNARRRAGLSRDHPRDPVSARLRGGVKLPSHARGRRRRGRGPHLPLALDVGRDLSGCRSDGARA